MAQSLYTAAVGMKAQQQRIDTLADNIANVNTNGFKKSRVDFKEALYIAMENPALPSGDETTNLRLGQGLLVDSVKKIFSDGVHHETGRNLDLAMTGYGFYALENLDGSMIYSRDGVFQSQAQIGGGYALVTINGSYVLDQNGDRITSMQSFVEMSVSENGQITVGGQYMAQLGRFSFTNPKGLEAIGGKSYLATESSGAAEVADAVIRQGYLESSNVDLSEEMTRLIRAQRAYALLGRAITTADQMKATENDIRR